MKLQNARYAIYGIIVGILFTAVLDWRSFNSDCITGPVCKGMYDGDNIESLCSNASDEQWMNTYLLPFYGLTGGYDNGELSIYDLKTGKLLTSTAMSSADSLSMDELYDGLTSPYFTASKSPDGGVRVIFDGSYRMFVNIEDLIQHQVIKN
jgi:hypothetical protein